MLALSCAIARPAGRELMVKMPELLLAIWTRAAGLVALLTVAVRLAWPAGTVDGKIALIWPGLTKCRRPGKCSCRRPP